MYLRLSREVYPDLYTEDTRFEMGKGTIVRDGSDVTVIACGIMVHKALEAAEKLAAEKYGSWEWTWGASPSFTEKKRRRFAWGRIECLLEVDSGLVRTCRIFGDFFARRPVEELEKLSGYTSWIDVTKPYETV